MKYLLSLVLAVIVALGVIYFVLADDKEPRPRPIPDKPNGADPKDENPPPDLVDWEREHRRRLTEQELKRWKQLLDKENQRRIAELKVLLNLDSEQVKSVRIAFDEEREEYE